MTTEKQLTANRKNALKSTGPKTEAGKAIVSQNALKHGVLSQKLLLLGEDEAEFIEMQQEMLAAFSPASELEEIIFDKLITAAWRLRRLHRIEQGIFAQPELNDTGNKSEEPSPEFMKALGLTYLQNVTPLALLTRYETMLDKAYWTAYNELRSLQTDRQSLADTLI